MSLLGSFPGETEREGEEAKANRPNDKRDPDSASARVKNER